MVGPSLRRQDGEDEVRGGGAEEGHGMHTVLKAAEKERRFLCCSCGGAQCCHPALGPLPLLTRTPFGQCGCQLDEAVHSLRADVAQHQVSQRGARVQRVQCLAEGRGERLVRHIDESSAAGPRDDVGVLCGAHTQAILHLPVVTAGVSYPVVLRFIIHRFLNHAWCCYFPFPLCVPLVSFLGP